MKTLAALFIALAMSTVVEADGFIKNPHNGHLYKVVHVPKGISWSDAKTAAEKAGGYLATITSEKENKFIKWLVNNKDLWFSNSPYDNFGPWIGGYQKSGGREPDGGWKWVTGEEFFYDNWAVMEPSGRWMGKDENRLQLYCKNRSLRNCYWNDSLDSPIENTTRSYIIEKGAIETESRDGVIKKPIDDFHEFHSVGGKTCKGRVLSYDPNNDTVTIVKETKRTHKVGLSCFSEADRTYVREWHLVKEFFAENRLKICAKDEPVGKKRKVEIHDNLGNQKALMTMENIGYVITLDNRSNSDLPGVSIDYCIYYEQDRPSGNSKRIDKGVKCGSLNIGTLAARAKVQVETQTVTITERQQQNGYVLGGKIQGIWIRVYLPLANNKKAMRECSTPNDLMKDRSWASSDIDATIKNW